MQHSTQATANTTRQRSGYQRVRSSSYQRFKIGTNKDSRIEANVNKGIKELLKTAATLEGIDMSAFIIASATDKAYQVLQQAETTILSAQEFLDLQNFIENPPRAGKGLKELKTSYSNVE